MLFFGSCAKYVTGSYDDSNILSMTSEDFDIQIATEMVLDLEKPILKISDGDFIKREDFEKLQNEYDIFSGESGINPLYTFIDVADLEDPTKNKFEVIGRYRYPTLFDGNIEITKAYIVTLTYKDNTPPVIELHINQEPVSGSGIATDFLRDYIYKPDGNGGWVFNSIGGTVNLPH